MTEPSFGRGIAGWGAYLPHWRLDLGDVAEVAGGGGGRGTRSVASYDEDATTMGVEAARRALAGTPPAHLGCLWFSTTAPPYTDRTNAAAIHAALRLDPAAGAFDALGAVRSGIGALRAALGGQDPHLVVTSDVRTGLPGGADEAAGGDGAAALLIGGPDDPETPVLAELVGSGSVTEEFLDRWRPPGELHSKSWEERFGETRYVPLGERAWDEALKSAGLVADQVDTVVIAGTHRRARRVLAGRLGAERVLDPFSGTVGATGAAEPALLLASALEAATPGQVVALVVLADGADALVFRATDQIAAREPARAVADQARAGASVDYGTYLRWRGLLATEPPRRPEPARPSASAAARSTGWKYSFTGAQDRSGEVHLPPRPGDEVPVVMADARGTIATFTVDRLAYSPSPPVVFAVVDFDGGGRLPVELTDVDLGRVRIGARVEMTFRRLFTADGIHNYFWKAKLEEGA